MLKWIFLDVKRTLQSKKTYLLFVIIFVSMIMFVYNYTRIDIDFLEEYGQAAIDMEIDEDDYIRHQLLGSITNSVYAFDYRCHSDVIYEDPNDYDEDLDCSDYEKYESSMAKFQEYYQKEDIENFYKLKLAYLNKFTNPFKEYYDGLSEEMKLATKNKVIAIESIFDIKAKIDEFEIDVELFTPSIDNLDSINYYNHIGVELIETYHNYINDYPLDVAYRINPGFFIANYIDSYFLLLVFSMILLIFDSYYRDFKSGVFKTILSSPKKRMNYVILKTISTIISSLILIALPLFIMSAYLYIKVGHTAINYPIYIQHQTLSSFKPRLIYSRIIGSEKPATYFSTYTIIHEFGPISRAVGDGGSLIFSNLKVIMLLEYLALVLSYFVLIIIFISFLNSILSIVLNNRIYNLLFLSLVVGLGLFLNKVLIGSVILKILPTTFLSPTKLLMQTIPYTYLNGLMTLSMSVIVSFIILSILIKKKDFTY